MDVLDFTKKKMNTAIDHFKVELKGLRTGRANPSALDPVTVDVYGSHLRLRDLASITVVEARQMVVTPFDANNLHAIAKGIDAANLNVKAIVDGNVVRIKIPEMDTAVRQEMCKQAKKKCEEAKISIRNIRREGNEMVKKQKADGLIAEDVLKKSEKNIQDLTDKYCKQCDELTIEKEKEIQTV